MINKRSVWISLEFRTADTDQRNTNRDGIERGLLGSEDLFNATLQRVDHTLSTRKPMRTHVLPYIQLQEQASWERETNCVYVRRPAQICSRDLTVFEEISVGGIMYSGRKVNAERCNQLLELAIA